MERVLVVDDEPQVLVALEDVLGRQFAVIAATRPDEALQLVARDPSIAVVISDERMPGMPGAEFLARVRRTSAARRILVTGFADQEAVVRAVNSGNIFAYVTKPWVDEDLRGKVKEAASQYRFERELATEHQLLQDLMHSAPDAIYFKDRQRRVRRVNAAFSKLFGLPDDVEVLGKTFEELELTQADGDEHREQELAVLAEGLTCRDVVRDHSSNGQRRWISETKAPIRTPSGEVVGLVCIARDVTENVRAQDSLRESERRYREQSNLLHTILNSMGEAVIAWTNEDQFVLFNREARKLFGSPNSGSGAKAWTERLGVYAADGDHRLDPADNPLARALAGQHHEIEVSVQGASLDRPILAGSSKPLQDEKGAMRGGVLLLRDVTEQRVLERQFAQAQKMDAVGRLAGGIAHDFNNLLSVIQGYAELLLSQPENDADREDLQEILTASHRATDLTRQLLAMGRARSQRNEIVQVSDVVQRLERMLGRVIPPNITLTSSFSPSAYPVKVDVGQLEQVLLNLALNARDAMPDGGILAFETSNVQVTGHRAGLEAGIEAGDYALLRVADTGSGMTAATKQRLFEPFFSTKEPGKGTGLGMAIVHGLVTEMRGHVRVESEIAKGSTFFIYLPRATEPSRSQSPRMARSQTKPARHAKVLIVEDDAAVRAITIRVLQANGHTVLAAGTPSEAMRICDTEVDIDLLLTDMMLPEIGGIELARRVVRKCPGIKVLFMSGYPDALPDNEEVFEPRPPVLQKPLSPAVLEEAVRDRLAQGE